MQIKDANRSHLEGKACFFGFPPNRGSENARQVRHLRKAGIV
jgi:hypothetical protein